MILQFNVHSFYDASQQIALVQALYTAVNKTISIVFPHTILDWNNLQPNILDITIIESFKVAI